MATKTTTDSQLVDHIDFERYSRLAVRSKEAKNLLVRKNRII